MAIMGLAFLGLRSFSFFVFFPCLKMGQTLLEVGLSEGLSFDFNQVEARAPTLAFLVSIGARDGNHTVKSVADMEELSKVSSKDDNTGLRQTSNSTSSSVSSKDNNTELPARSRNMSRELFSLQQLPKNVTRKERTQLVPPMLTLHRSMETTSAEPTTPSTPSVPFAPAVNEDESTLASFSSTPKRSTEGNDRQGRPHPHHKEVLSKYNSTATKRETPHKYLRRLGHYCAKRNRLTDPTRFPRDTKGIAFPHFLVSPRAAAAAAERRSNNSRKRITVFGIGTGRSGTASLARLLQRQNNSAVSHENGPKILQQAGSGCSSARIVWAGDFRMAVKQKKNSCDYPFSFPSLFFPSTKMIFHAGL
jgi:hypothetical protein